MATSEFLTPAQVVPLFPERPPHPNTVRNWMVVGCRGIKLDYDMVGDRYITTREKVEKFKAALKARHGGRKEAARQQGISNREALRVLGV